MHSEYIDVYLMAYISKHFQIFLKFKREMFNLIYVTGGYTALVVFTGKTKLSCDK